MPKIGSLGALSSRGFGEFAQSGPVTYIEDVFSTYLYTGNGSTQTITNGIDLSGKGGLVWIKGRGGVSDHILQNNLTQYISSNTTASASDPTSVYVTSFNTNGFNLGFGDAVNKATAPSPYVSWTWRKNPKFFDVVTYTGDGSTSWRYINHNLQATPAFIIVKNLSRASDWLVYSPIAAGSGYNMILNSTAPSQASNESQGRVYATSSTQFQVICTNASGTPVTGTNVNQSGDSYVAYLFASNAGGFGLDGSQNVISCGLITTNSSGAATVNLGYEPQYVMIKATSTTDGWAIVDNMRGNATLNGTANTEAVLSGGRNIAEFQSYGYANPLSTGFELGSWGATPITFVYMAIRRGPMKVPTDATTIFAPVATNASNNPQGGFPLDLWWLKARNGVEDNILMDRLRWPNVYLVSNTTGAEANNPTNYYRIDNMTGGFSNGGSYSQYIHWLMRRAPSFMDIVCYTGTGSARTVSHNLGVAPELMIVKPRSLALGWATYSAAIGVANYLTLNSTSPSIADPGNVLWNNTSPTSTVFTVGTNSTVNSSGGLYVAYLFATCPGVSKVGSYTGTGATQTISCGFTGGARYVLIKRTDSSGDWWVWDTARGMVAGTDPRLSPNSTATETNANWVYTTTGGFQIVTSDATVNANGGSYIYLAIA